MDGSVCILQQTEYNCIKRCQAQFGPPVLDALKKKECGKFWALVLQFCDLFLNHPFLPA